MQLNEIAQLAHNVNYVYCLQIGDISASTWEEAPGWQKESCIAGVTEVLKSIASGVAVAPWAQHRSWMQYKAKEGWKYGPVKDAEKKTHPCMVPYEELPKEQRLKDFLFIAVVESCSKFYVP